MDYLATMYIENNSQKGLSAQAGISLIIVFFVMVMIVASLLFTSLFLYNRISLIKNISNSVNSFYLADTGIEKVFYHDRKIIPGGAARGLCYMCANQGSCQISFLNCSCTLVHAGEYDPAHGCDWDVCDDCTLSFTTFYENKQFSVKTIVLPPADPNDIEIQSWGLFKGIGRAIEVFINK